MESDTYVMSLREERRITAAARTPDFRKRKKRVANWEEDSDFFG